MEKQLIEYETTIKKIVKVEVPEEEGFGERLLDLLVKEIDRINKEKEREVIKEVPVMIEVEKLVKVEKLVEVPVYIEKIIEKPVYIEKTIEQPVYIEKIVEVEAKHEEPVRNGRNGKPRYRPKWYIFCSILK